MYNKNKPICISNAIEYIKSLDENYETEELKNIYVTFREQDDYGNNEDILDCSITSISSLIEFCIFYGYNKKNKEDFQDIYNKIKEYAKEKFIYTTKSGTKTIFINTILKNFNKHYNLNLKSFQKSIKGIGYNFSTIKSVIDTGKPVILSVSSANYGYYKSHTILIRGYIIYKINNKNITLLIINDNWSSGMRFIDYDTISCISSINYYI
jgi:hypothetical protein